MSAAKPNLPQTPAEWLEVSSMDMEAQGVAHRSDGKVVFIDGALPGELVSARTRRSKNQWEQADLSEIHRESSLRTRPLCPHFGLHAGACGGCKMQHLDAAAQVAMKQRVLEDNLWHLGKVRPETVLPAIHGPAWAYRYRARLAVRHVLKKGTVLVGFHERKSRYIADMRTCKILPPHVDALLLPLRALVASLAARDTCPQIELACGDALTVLVLRHLEPLSRADQDKLRAFGQAHGVQWWLQPKGPDTAHPMDEGGAPLNYQLPEFGITIAFRPTDFTQVNPQINRVLVGRALALLKPERTERVIDWFCGLGNFTLPIATRAGSVLGVEGSSALIARARENFVSNQAQRLAGQALAATEFEVKNLFEITPQELVAYGSARRWLVDPPREGAFALVKALADMHQAGLQAGGAPPLPEGAQHWQPPERIVYVSCNPATLARDAGLLVHQAGYRCSAAGVVNMFPHTAHVESMAVFERAA
ncbi:23S rRNA (uracil(1939)-C(5))-methyltransferase RlmD [Comamonas sp. NLF-1-9]|uniref:23S rRNA (uracil(1939)-C(5))-methyltransferase RlmD n=1 Tax=Comamonas sp. NLF-1-9 TaxID=2853163 RepID=UPI001C44B66C|nr:23S rRNA (uracil(1939)-C(5))-methyltransferase RlmD [Comamonas sp. NLF-1-9]QXL84860.1 23S rRNA (uracil(1939)-C(5))-methyltransferase RlmD [Comamonas sp. NLF-1-9]